MLLFVKVCFLIAAVLLFISSVLVLFFKKDYLMITYKDNLKEGLLSKNFTKFIGIVTMIFSIAYVIVILISIIIEMETDEFLIAFLTVTMIFLFVMAITMIIRSMFVKNSNITDEKE